MSNYGWDLNRIVSKGNEMHNHQLEGFGMNLESFLLDNPELSPDAEKLTDMIIYFLHGLVGEDDEDYSQAYENGYKEGFKEAEGACDCW